MEILSDEEFELDKVFFVLIFSVFSGFLGVYINVILIVLVSDDFCGVFIFFEKSRFVKVEEVN